ncbi:MAG: glycosyltransferase family 4 protein [Cyclobacteriaceae bacterium]
MKIAFVTNTCWNVFNFREGLVRHFLERGDEVISLAPSDEYTAEIEQWGVRHIETPLDQTGTNPVRDFSYLNAIRKIFKTERPDVALSFTIKSNIYASIGGKWTGVPVICNVSGLGTVFLVEGWLGKVAINLYRLAFRYSSLVFFQNTDDRELFTSFIQLDETKIGILPGSGINLKKFSYVERRTTSPIKFLMISRIIEEKGVREFVESAKQLSAHKDAIDFTLVGKLDEEHSRSIPESELKAWINEGLINYQPHSSEIADLIADHDVVVLPSYREGTPRTLLEGAAIGRALLASDVPGCREVVEDGRNGFLFEVRNTQNLTDKIKLYLSLSESERTTLGRNSRKLVEEKFDESLVIRKYEEAITQIVDK